VTFIKIDRSSRLRYDQGEFVLSRRDGKYLEFDDVKMGRILRLTDDELAAAIEDDVASIMREGVEYDPITMRERAIEDLSILSEGDRWEADRRAAYVNALIEAGLGYRPSDAEAIAVIERVAEERDEKVPSLRSVQRWRKRTGGERAVAGRMASRHRDKGPRGTRMDPDRSRIWPTAWPHSPFARRWMVR
jgi:hypothetical protein